MSDKASGKGATPICDNAMQQIACFADHPAVECLSDLARQLERENIALRVALQNLLKAADNSNCCSTRCMEARETLAALTK